MTVDDYVTRPICVGCVSIGSCNCWPGTGWLCLLGRQILISDIEAKYSKLFTVTEQ